MVALAMIIAVCGCASHNSDVSDACAKGWVHFNVVMASGGRISKGRLTDRGPTEADDAAVVTLHRCSNPDEWWAGAKPYRSGALHGEGKQSVLDEWCHYYEEAEPAVCLAR